MVGGGAIEGLALGFAQSRVLRSWIPALSGRKWIVVTMVGAAAAWLVGMTASVVAPEPEGTVAASLVVTVGLVVCAVLGAILVFFSLDDTIRIHETSTYKAMAAITGVEHRLLWPMLWMPLLATAFLVLWTTAALTIASGVQYMILAPRYVDWGPH